MKQAFRQSRRQVVSWPKPRQADGGRERRPEEGQPREPPAMNMFQAARDRPKMRMATSSQRTTLVVWSCFRKSPIAAGLSTGPCSRPGRPKAPLDAAVIDRPAPRRPGTRAPTRTSSNVVERACGLRDAAASGQDRERNAGVIGDALLQAELARLHAQHMLDEQRAHLWSPGQPAPAPARARGVAPGGNSVCRVRDPQLSLMTSRRVVHTSFAARTKPMTMKARITIMNQPK